MAVRRQDDKAYSVTSRPYFALAMFIGAETERQLSGCRTPQFRLAFFDASPLRNKQIVSPVECPSSAFRTTIPLVPFSVAEPRVHALVPRNAFVDVGNGRGFAVRCHGQVSQRQRCTVVPSLFTSKQHDNSGQCRLINECVRSFRVGHSVT